MDKAPVSLGSLVDALESDLDKLERRVGIAAAMFLMDRQLFERLDDRGVSVGGSGPAAGKL